MGVYIDMEMPKVEDEFVEVLIFGDGKVIKTGKSWRCKEDGKCYYESLTPEEFFHAAEISESHGDLIDRHEAYLRFGKLAETLEERNGYEAGAPYAMAAMFLNNANEFPTEGE